MNYSHDDRTYIRGQIKREAGNGFSLGRIANHFKSLYRTSWWDISLLEMGDVGISTEWDIFQIPVDIASSDQYPRMWCKMWRWVKYSNKPEITLGKKRASEPMDSANSDSVDATSE